MSLSFLIRKTLSGVTRRFQPNLTSSFTTSSRSVSFSRVLNNDPEPAKEESDEVEEIKKKTVKIIPVETSIKYLQSTAYKTTYGTEPVWKNYRRNHKGALAPLKTRRTCIRAQEISTGNPCPICRDEYLVLSPENTELLKQFISPFTGEILSFSVTGICQKRHKQLVIAIEIAKDKGLIVYDVPFREYNYSDYKN